MVTPSTTRRCATRFGGGKAMENLKPTKPAKQYRKKVTPLRAPKNITTKIFASLLLFLFTFDAAYSAQSCGTKTYNFRNNTNSDITELWLADMRSFRLLSDRSDNQYQIDNFFSRIEHAGAFSSIYISENITNQQRNYLIRFNSYDSIVLKLHFTNPDVVHFYIIEKACNKHTFAIERDKQKSSLFLLNSQ